jgi:hypothetical protein
MPQIKPVTDGSTPHQGIKKSSSSGGLPCDTVLLAFSLERILLQNIGEMASAHLLANLAHLQNDSQHRLATMQI